jgi:hypothetical protein
MFQPKCLTSGVSEQAHSLFPLAPFAWNILPTSLLSVPYSFFWIHLGCPFQEDFLDLPSLGWLFQSRKLNLVLCISNAKPRGRPPKYLISEWMNV